ncbi:ankyrin repeat domain-containing protein [Streptomyces sp. NPDC059002]|uniref:ankyrin repeat domain-containing protein n=1 Tax=Streptomyces sp. NPDC059002 TaxID=3346690 RepID=UPI00367B7A97
MNLDRQAGRTAQDLAAREGHAETVRLLLAAGADPQQQTGEYDEMTPLRQAAMHGHTEVVGVLLDAGAPTGAQGRMGYVPLVLAATSGDHGHPQTVDLLLDLDVRGQPVFNALANHIT